MNQDNKDLIQHEQMVLNYIDKHGTIQRSGVADLCRISPAQRKLHVC